MIRGKIVFRKGNWGFTTNVVKAVMKRTISSFHGTDNKIEKPFA
jgi:hypothetical protein